MNTKPIQFRYASKSGARSVSLIEFKNTDTLLAGIDLTKLSEAEIQKLNPILESIDKDSAEKDPRLKIYIQKAWRCFSKAKQL